MSKMEKMLKINDVCKIFGINRSTLWHWRNKGLKFVNIHGRIYFRKEDVEKYIQAGEGKFGRCNALEKEKVKKS